MTVITGRAQSEIVHCHIACTFGIDTLYRGWISFPDDLKLWKAAYRACSIDSLNERTSWNGVSTLTLRISVAADEVPILGPLDRHVVSACGADTDMLLRVKCILDLLTDIIGTFCDLLCDLMEHIL